MALWPWKFVLIYLKRNLVLESQGPLNWLMQKFSNISSYWRIFNNFRLRFFTAILHRGLRNDFFSLCSFTFSIFFLLLFPFSLSTYFLFYSDSYFLFLFWTFISLSFLFSLLSLDICLLFSFLTFIQSRSHFGFLPNFFYVHTSYRQFVKLHFLCTAGF